MNDLIIAALKAQCIVIQAEIDARSGYTMNRDFILECAVKRESIKNILAVIDKLEKK